VVTGNFLAGFAPMLAAVSLWSLYLMEWFRKEIVEALNNLDLPVIMGFVLVISTTFVVINILVDIMPISILKSD
jgi:peptide/nickel transport system permease protein